MTTANGLGTKDIFPSLRYDHASAAIEWLVDVVGFEKHLVVPGDGGGIAHAELRLGSLFIMLGSTPKEGPFAGPVSNEGPYVALDGVKQLYDRVTSKGAGIVQPLEDKDYGGSGFSVRDPEGRVWSFGSYMPSPEPA